MADIPADKLLLFRLQIWKYLLVGIWKSWRPGLLCVVVVVYLRESRWPVMLGGVVVYLKGYLRAACRLSDSVMFAKLRCFFSAFLWLKLWCNLSKLHRWRLSVVNIKLLEGVLLASRLLLTALDDLEVKILRYAISWPTETRIVLLQAHISYRHFVNLMHVFLVACLQKPVRFLAQLCWVFERRYLLGWFPCVADWLQRLWGKHDGLRVNVCPACGLHEFLGLVSIFAQVFTNVFISYCLTPIAIYRATLGLQPVHIRYLNSLPSNYRFELLQFELPLLEQAVITNHPAKLLMAITSFLGCYMTLGNVLTQTTLTFMRRLLRLWSVLIQVSWCLLRLINQVSLHILLDLICGIVSLTFHLVDFKFQRASREGSLWAHHSGLRFCFAWDLTKRVAFLLCHV